MNSHHKFQLETNAIEPRNISDGNTYRIEIPLFESMTHSDTDEEYEKHAVDLTNKIRLLKAFSNLRLHTQARKKEKKSLELVQDTHNKEKLNGRVEDLLKEEVV